MGFGTSLKPRPSKTHSFFSPFSPSVHTDTIENGGVRVRKRKFSKTLSIVDGFENVGSASCVDARKRTFSKTLFIVDGFENVGSASCVDAQNINRELSKTTTSLASKKHSQQGKLSGIRWSSVDGRKR